MSKKVKENETTETLTPTGKISLLIFTIFLVIAAVYNRVDVKEKKEAKVEVVVYKTRRELGNLLDNIGENYKENVTITTDLFRKNIIISKDNSNTTISIKDYNGIIKYLKTPTKLYELRDKAEQIEDAGVLNEIIEEIVSPAKLAKIVENAKVVADITEDKYYIKRLSFNLNDLEENASGNVTIDINYKDKLESINIDCTDYYNYVMSSKETTVIYDIYYKEIGTTTIDEIGLYNIENNLQ